MKFLSVLTSALCLTSALAAPFSGPAETSDLVARGRGHSSDDDSGSDSGSGKPTVQTLGRYRLQAAASKGKTGVWFDSTNKVTHIYFGDDMKEHASHIELYNTLFPGRLNNGFKGVASKTDKDANRKVAFDGMARIVGFVRDEKPWASLAHGSTQVTVAQVSKTESNVERDLANAARMNYQKYGGVVVLHDHRTSVGTGPLTPILKIKDGNNVYTRGVDWQPGQKLPSSLGLPAVPWKMMKRDNVLGQLTGQETSTDTAYDNQTAESMDSFVANATTIIQPVLQQLNQTYTWGSANSSMISYAFSNSTAVSSIHTTSNEVLADALLSQLVGGETFVIGSLWNGMYAGYDEYEDALQKNGTLTNSTMALDYAIIQTYMDGWNNATQLLNSSGYDQDTMTWIFESAVNDTGSGPDSSSSDTVIGKRSLWDML